MTRFLKERKPDSVVYLVDAPGSGLHAAIEAKCRGEEDGKQGSVMGRPIVWYPRSEGSSITEGIGTDRKTANFAQAIDQIDGVIAATDQEAGYGISYFA